MPPQCLDAVADWLDVPLSDGKRRSLVRYGEWLTNEGVAMGGLGPAEASRVWRRHICDSLTFGFGLPSSGSLIDVGSGIGLPGVPLAIAFPNVAVTLVERSGRRIDALHRIAAMLDLSVTIVHRDATQMAASVDRAVFRASLRLEAAMSLVPQLLSTSGEAWFGLGRGSTPEALDRWRSSPPPIPANLHVEEVLVPATVLDSEVWLLRMTPL